MQVKTREDGSLQVKVNENGVWLTANYLPNVFRGWVAFRHGKTVKTKDGRIKTFRTAEAALSAARKSRMQFGTR